MPEILKLDDGIYRTCKVEGAHVLPWLTKQVVTKFATEGKDADGRDIDVKADLQRHVERALKRFGRSDDGSARSELIKEFAVDGYGLAKELDARGINTRRDTGAKFLSVGSNSPLFPAFAANTFVEGRLSAGLVAQLVYTDVQIAASSYDKVRLSDVEGDRQMRNVAIGGPLPVTELSYVETNIPMRKYGRLFQYAREVMELSPLDVVAGFLRKLGAQVAIDETDEILHILHAGDGEASSAVTDTTPETDGTLAYSDLIKLELAFANNYAGSVYLADATNFQTILGMAEYKDPLANRGVGLQNGIPNVPTPSGMGRIYRWSSTNCSHMAETGGRIAAADNTAACYVVRKGDILEEQDQLIQSGKQQVALSYMMAVVKGDPAAFKSLDVTA